MTCTSPLSHFLLILSDCHQMNTSSQSCLFDTRSLLPQPLGARTGQRNKVKICQTGRQWKSEHRPSSGWFIGLISENGKVKLITFPPENAAQQWQMTSCQGQTVSHPWSLCLCAPSSNRVTQGATCQMPPSGWLLPGQPPPQPLHSLLDGYECMGPMI